MPNWCYNSLEITHEDPEVVRELIDRLKSLEENRYGDLQGFFRGLYPDYEYREATDIDWNEMENSIFASFSSAWEPPIELYEELVDEGWSVTASYYEEGLDFAGIYEDGDNRRLDNLSDYPDEFFETDELGIEIQDEWDILSGRDEDWEEVDLED